MLFKDVKVTRDKQIQGLEHSVFKQLDALSRCFPKKQQHNSGNSSIEFIGFEKALQELAQLNNSTKNLLQ